MAKIERFPDYEFREDGAVLSTRTKSRRAHPRAIGIRTAKTGYRIVRLRNADGTHGTHLVHRLILEAFDGPCPDGMQACHRNGNRSDNRICNLRWDTPQANTDDKIRHGTVYSGARHHSTKLTLEDIAEVCRLYAAGGVTYRYLAYRFGVSSVTICKIVNKRHSMQKREAING